MQIKTFREMIFVILMAFAPAALAGGDAAQEAIQRGNDAFARGQYELAMLEYQEVLLGFTSHYPTARYNIGVCHYKLGRAKEAIESYERAIGLTEDPAIRRFLLDRRG